MPSGKMILHWSAAALAVLYIIRYVRNSNATVASIYPQGTQSNPSGVAS